MLTKADERKVKDIIVQAIEEVIAPAMDSLADKEDVKRLEKKVDKLEIRMDSLETRVEQMDRKLDIVTGKIFEHDSKIKKLEQRVAHA